MTAKVLEKKFVVPFVLITSLFALWGFANDITNPVSYTHLTRPTILLV